MRMRTWEEWTRKRCPGKGRNESFRFFEGILDDEEDDVAVAAAVCVAAWRDTVVDDDVSGRHHD